MPFAPSEDRCSEDGNGFQSNEIAVRHSFHALWRICVAVQLICATSGTKPAASSTQRIRVDSSRKQDSSSCGNGDGHISALGTLIIILSLRRKLIEIKRHPPRRLSPISFDENLVALLPEANAKTRSSLRYAHGDIRLSTSLLVFRCLVWVRPR